jgi:phosphate transport system permease protein
MALRVAGWSFLTTEAWEPESGNFGIAAVLVGTILIALVAIAVAVPLAAGAALYISEYAPRRFRSFFVSLVDLMAAVPSVVFGIWGAYLLQWRVIDVSRWITTYFGWIPFLRVEGTDPRDPLATPTVYTASTFVAGLVVALMVAPIACSVMREAFSQAPIGEREGTMLGLGRALGETIAIFLIISPVFIIQPHILQQGANSVSSLIALRYGDSTAMGISALMAAGLALFIMTLIVNFVASSIVARSRSGAVSE